MAIGSHQTKSCDSERCWSPHRYRPIQGRMLRGHCLPGPCVYLSGARVALVKLVLVEIPGRHILRAKVMGHRTVMTMLRRTVVTTCMTMGSSSIVPVVLDAVPGASGVGDGVALVSVPCGRAHRRRHAHRLGGRSFVGDGSRSWRRGGGKVVAMGFVTSRGLEAKLIIFEFVATCVYVPTSSRVRVCMYEGRYPCTYVGIQECT